MLLTFAVVIVGLTLCHSIIWSMSSPRMPHLARLKPRQS